MPEPDPPFHPSCWAWTRGEWRQARRLSDHPIPGTALSGWDPDQELWMVRTHDGYVAPVPTHHLVLIDPEVGVWPEAPAEPPEDWEPGPDEAPAFLG